MTNKKNLAVCLASILGVSFLFGVGCASSSPRGDSDSDADLGGDFDTDASFDADIDSRLDADTTDAPDTPFDTEPDPDGDPDADGEIDVETDPPPSRWETMTFCPTGADMNEENTRGRMRFDLDRDGVVLGNRAARTAEAMVPNSSAGTVTKVTLERESLDARYRVSPNPVDVVVDPDRRAFILSRDEGVVTAIAIDPRDCIDRDGDGVVTTSTGEGHVLPLGVDECMLWTSFAVGGMSPGFIFLDPFGRLWVAGEDRVGGGAFYVIDPATGDLENTLATDAVPRSAGIGRDRSLWYVSDDSFMRAIDVDRLEETDRVEIPECLGERVVTADPGGDLWLSCSEGSGQHLHRFSRASESWESFDQGRHASDLVVDDDRVWIETGGGDLLHPSRILAVDSTTGESLMHIEAEGCTGATFAQLDVWNELLVLCTGTHNMLSLNRHTGTFDLLPVGSEPIARTAMSHSPWTFPWYAQGTFLHVVDIRDLCGDGREASWSSISFEGSILGDTDLLFLARTADEAGLLWENPRELMGSYVAGETTFELESIDSRSIEGDQHFLELAIQLRSYDWERVPAFRCLEVTAFCH